MPPTARFADIKFNLMRAIEFFEDMNYLDMDVAAPASSHTYFKEIEVAQRLNIFLSQLIEEGVFDDCDLREEEGSDEEPGEEELDEECEDDQVTGHSHSHSHTRSGPHLHSRSRSHSHSGSPSRSHSHSRSHSSESISPRSEGFNYRGGRGSADTENQEAELDDE